MRLKFILICVACFTFFQGNSQTDDGRANDTSAILVAEDIYMIKGKGGNIAVSIGVDGVLMVDAQYAEGTEEILKVIRRLNDGPINFLVNTHAHGDHTGGNANIAKEGAAIIAHDEVFNALTKKRKEADKSSNGAKMDEDTFPVITFNDKMTLYQNEEEILVFHLDNAHTNGDAVVYFTNSNVLHTGDLLFNKKYPNIDLDGGGSVKGYIDALDKLFMLCDNDTKIIPGHGELARMADIRAARNMLSDLHRNVTYQFLQGKSEAQIVAMRDFTAKYDLEGYGNGYISTEKILKIIYKEVSKDQADFDPRSAKERLEAYKKAQEQRAKRSQRRRPQEQKELSKEEREAILKQKIKDDEGGGN